MNGDIAQGLIFATIPAFLGIVALVKGWKLRTEQPLQAAVIVAALLFLAALIIAFFAIKFPVI
jgi:ABC-type Na+ efflux pump permease subunit